MNVVVSKHAVKRYKERIIKKKTTSGDKCVNSIKKALKNTTKITENRDKDIYYYHTKDFIARIQKKGTILHVITILDIPREVV